MGTSTRQTAGAVGDSRLVETGARLGYAANGVLHLLIAWIALQLAWSSTSGEADQSGALGSLAGTSWGSALLWVIVAGFALLGLWQLAETVTRREATDKVKAFAKTCVYVAVAVTAVGILRGSGSSSRDQASSFTATLLSQPYGRVLVMAVGAAVVGVGIYHVVKGWRAGFLADLRAHPGTWAVRAGRVGYVAKGAALAVVGGLFVVAGLHSDASQAQGLDGALRTLRDLPLGKALLTLVALGLAAYGVYSFARSRYAKV